MNQSQITLWYAKALFDLAVDQNLLEKVKSDMALIGKVSHENHELKNMLSNPVISLDKKLKVMQQVFGQHVEKLSMQFITILSRKRREHYLIGIATAFVDLYKEFKGIKTAYITTAVPMSDPERQTILGLLKKLSGCEIELIENLKANLIGGFVLRMENYQLDQSVQSQIKQLRKDFKKNLYIKGF